jgi:hypothetical protein
MYGESLTTGPTRGIVPLSCDRVTCVIPVNMHDFSLTSRIGDPDPLRSAFVVAMAADSFTHAIRRALQKHDYRRVRRRLDAEAVVRLPVINHHAVIASAHARETARSRPHPRAGGTRAPIRRCRRRSLRSPYHHCAQIRYSKRPPQPSGDGARPSRFRRAVKDSHRITTQSPSVTMPKLTTPQAHDAAGSSLENSCRLSRTQSRESSAAA